MDNALYRRSRYLALTLLMILALGLAALQSIGRQEDPTITNLFATIVTPYPGASPERVEALVTEKIEAELRPIDAIEHISSTSSTGVSSIQVELSPFLPDGEIEQIWSEIRDALSDAATTLPDGVPEPSFDDDRVGAFTAIYAVAAREGREVSLAVLSRYAELLQDALRRAPGVELAKLYGEAEEEVLVTVDAERLAGLGLAPGAVSAAIAAADAKVRAGRVRGEGSDYLIEVAGEIETLDRIREAPIATGRAGRILRVGDVAEIRRSVTTPPESIAFSDGERAVLVAARMAPDRQVDAWMTRLEQEVAGFEARLPDALEIRRRFDQSAYTAERLGGVAGNLAMGVGLVIAVLFITMGWRAALIVGAMLPLTSLLSLFVLDRLGVSIEQMSVTGLIVALGLLVDAAIVTTDEIRRRLEQGMPRAEAVGAAVRRLAIPLLASTVTTVLAFTPMALLPGPAGDFVGSIALSVIVMLTASLLLALTVTPALAGRVLPESVARPRWWRDGARGGRLARAFGWSLRLSLRERGLSILAAMAPAIVGFAAFPTLTAEFFPAVERDQLYVQAILPEGAAIARTEAAARKIDAALRADPDVATVDWVVGENAPAFYYNMLANRDLAPGFAEALVTTASPEAAERLLLRLQPALDASVPEAQILVRGLAQGPPVVAPLEMRLVGPELDTLRRLGQEARRRMAELPAVIHTSADLMGGAPKLVFDLDEDKARLAGLELSEAARQIARLVEGAQGGSLVEGSEELPVRVRLDSEARASADRIAALALLPADAPASAAAGAFPGTPLGALGEVTLAPSASPIARRDGERLNTVRAYLQRGVLPEESLALLMRRLEADPIALPQGYRIEWGGDSDARAETIGNLTSTLGLVIALSVATIVLTFNSWRLSGVAFLVMGLSMGLSLLSLALFEYPFGIVALIGVIGSIGVSINAAIIIMTALQEDAAAARGEPEAIRRVVMESSRHIVSTTVTTFGGFLPLLLESGGFWPPFAMSIAGGVLLSTLVSFYFVPPMFSLAVGRPRPLEAPERPAAPLAAAAA